MTWIKADGDDVPGHANGRWAFPPSTITVTVLGLSLVLVLTRIISTFNSRPKPAADHGTAKTVPAVPYWLPVLGHIPNMAIDADGFVRRLREIYSNGIFALNFGGSRHNIIYSPGLAIALLNEKSSHAGHEAVSKRLMRLNFGFPAKEMNKYEEALDDLMACYRYISSEPYLETMVQQTTQKTKESIQNLVTQMTSPVDQMPWEKVSNVKIIERPNSERVVEASLLPLIRDFCAFTANPSLMGSDFLENFPEFFDDIWSLDRGFLLLATGLPRWTPIPTLTRAHISRKRNLDRLDDFHRVLERYWNGDNPGSKWSNLEDVGPLIKARMEVYRKHDLSIRARASVEHALMWAANANSNTLVFWMVNRIFEDRALVAMIREEIAPYLEIKQEDHGLPIAEPPRITKLDVKGLCNDCPLLKSCYVECLRVDTGSWSFKSIKQDVLLQSREKDAQPWLLRKGDYAHVAHDLHNSDPAHFENAEVWKAHRHIRYDEKGKATAELGSIRPYGGGTSMCKGRAFALKENMMFTAAIVAMWDIEAAGGGSWKMPRHRKATGVYTTGDNTRVWIKRRTFPAS